MPKSTWLSAKEPFEIYEAEFKQKSMDNSGKN